VASAFVTGAAGFIGSHICKKLLENGHTVYGADNFVTSTETHLPDGVEMIGVDIRYMSGIPKEVKWVFHTAAIARSAWDDEVEVFSTNVGGTQKIVDMMYENFGNSARLIYSSSSMSGLPTTNTYAFSKFRGEQIALGFPNSVALRYSNVYGVGQSMIGSEPNVLAAWRRQRAEQGWIRVDGDGQQVRDFIHVEDVVDANVVAMYKGSGWYDICTGRQQKILDIAKRFDVPIKFAERRPFDPDVIVQSPYQFGHETNWFVKRRFDDFIDAAIA
jgi:UDP-glucose 4-epimerase